MAKEIKFPSKNELGKYWSRKKYEYLKSRIASSKSRALDLSEHYLHWDEESIISRMDRVSFNAEEVVYSIEELNAKLIHNLEKKNYSAELHVYVGSSGVDNFFDLMIKKTNSIHSLSYLQTSNGHSIIDVKLEDETVKGLLADIEIVSSFGKLVNEKDYKEISDLNTYNTGYKKNSAFEKSTPCGKVGIEVLCGKIATIGNKRSLTIDELKDMSMMSRGVYRNDFKKSVVGLYQVDFLIARKSYEQAIDWIRDAPEGLVVELVRRKPFGLVDFAFESAIEGIDMQISDGFDVNGKSLMESDIRLSVSLFREILDKVGSDELKHALDRIDLGDIVDEMIVEYAGLDNWKSNSNFMQSKFSAITGMYTLNELANLFKQEVSNDFVDNWLKIGEIEKLKDKFFKQKSPDFERYGLKDPFNLLSVTKEELGHSKDWSQTLSSSSSVHKAGSVRF